MLLAGVAWLVESYDVGVIGSVLPSLQKEFQLGALSVGLLAIASTLGIVIAAILFGVLHNPVLSLSCGIILAFFGIGVDPVIKIYGAEQYPTRIRETGIGLFEGVGRFFGGALAPFIMAFLLTGIGLPGSYLFVALLALVGIGAVAFFGTETKGRSIEHASEIPRPGAAPALRNRPARKERSGEYV